MQSKKFQRRIENFVCDHCGATVKGNGYTDHCPICLWGKHVDINPGDRAADCRGLMKLIRTEMNKEKYLLYYTCKKCGYNFRVKSMPDDDLDTIIRFMNK
jgi:rubrerythrin